MQDKCNSQAFSIQELEAKLEEEVAQKGELERQLDEKAEMCRQIQVRTFLFFHNINYTQFHVLACFCKQKELTHKCECIQYS